MPIKKIITYTLTIVIVIGLLLFVLINKDWFFKYSSEEKNIDQEIIYPEAEQSHKVVFEDRELFLKAVGDYPFRRDSMNPGIKGGIIPHHILPSFIIADFFSCLSAEEIETIVLVGPNHYERGNFSVITSGYKWETPFGVLKPDIEIITDFEGKKIIEKDETVIPLDHSMTSILPFIQYYLPEVKVVPLILKSDFSEKEVDELAGELRKYIQSRKVILLASVDFSHYLTNFEAKEKNTESLEAIKKRSYDEIFAFGNEHMDSPASVALVLKVMDAIDSKQMTVLHDTNSGEMIGDNFAQITSYLSLSFSTNK